MDGNAGNGPGKGRVFPCPRAVHEQEINDGSRMQHRQPLTETQGRHDKNVTGFSV